MFQSESESESESESKSRMLIIGPAWIGDMVMAQTLFILLKQQQPERKIDVMAPSWTLPLLERMPEVDQSIAFPLGHGKLKLRQRYAIGKALRQAHYQESIVLPNSFKSALIPFWAKISRRTGWGREGRRLLLNDSRHLDKAAYPLMIQRFAALAYPPYPPQAVLPDTLPKPKFAVKITKILAALQNHQLVQPTKPILALCPGAEFGSSKRWPEVHYARIANEKLDQAWEVWLFGSEKDRAITEKVNTLTHHRCVDLAGKTTLSEAIDLLSLTKIVVTNDSGLMHIAAALEKPLVAIYGSTSPQFTPPLTDQAKIVAHSIECSPCFQRECPLKHQRCMTELAPDKVLIAIHDLLHDNSIDTPSLLFSKSASLTSMDD
jgi:heptosyltransferase-2